MDFNNAFRGIVGSRGYTITSAAEAAGITYGALSSALVKNNPSVAAMNRYIKALGYQVALVPVGTKLPDGSYVLEAGVER